MFQPGHACAALSEYHDSLIRQLFCPPTTVFEYASSPLRTHLLSNQGPTSKMSHGHSGRDSCFGTFSGTMLHFEVPEAARGVTDVDVGSGALLGEADEARESIQSRFNSGTPKRPSE